MPFYSPSEIGNYFFLSKTINGPGAEGNVPNVQQRALSQSPLRRQLDAWINLDTWTSTFSLPNDHGPPPKKK
jgi:hypothetical protein